MRLHIALGSCAAGALLSLAVSPREARADSIINRPGMHIDYTAELEPHINIAFLRYGGPKFGKSVGDPEFGAGFRASIPVGGPLFVPKINDTIAITFGIDLTGCPSYCAHGVYFRAPVGLQWNFYFTREFSAFADFGGLIRADAGGGYPDFFAMLGGRYLFAKKTSLTFRIGYPFVSVGVSFFVG